MFCRSRIARDCEGHPPRNDQQQTFRFRMSSRDFGRGSLRARFYFGGCRPGELAHSWRWAAVSACRALRSMSACSRPGGSRAALARASSANAARRSRNEIIGLIRRRLIMSCTSAACVTGGSANGVLITDRSPELCGDRLMVRFASRKSESSIRYHAGNFSRLTQVSQSEISPLFSAAF